MKQLLTTLSLVLLSFVGYSQESEVEFQFIQALSECDDNAVCWDVQVRLISVSPSQTDGTVELADVNYRIFFPANLMTFHSATGLLPNYF
ncbi:MAG: hypothetical protein AAGK97_06615, partial [Bacteroidota bacterium]